MTDQQYAERVIRIATIAGCTIAVSLVFTFGGYFHSHPYTGSPRFNSDYILQDTIPAMKERALIGAFVGVIVGFVVAFKPGGPGKPGGGEDGL
jgi:hypothetical protein